jgi:hypothetical protein
MINNILLEQNIVFLLVILQYFTDIFELCNYAQPGCDITLLPFPAQSFSPKLYITAKLPPTAAAIPIARTPAENIEGNALSLVYEDASSLVKADHLDQSFRGVMK